MFNPTEIQVDEILTAMEIYCDGFMVDATEAALDIRAVYPEVALSDICEYMEDNMPTLLTKLQARMAI